MKWTKEFQDGCNYHDAAKGLLAKKKVDNEVIYNIISMAIEQYASALSSWLKFMPVHSGLGSVFRELKSKIEMPVHFTDQVRFLNRFMTYCSLEVTDKPIVSDVDIAQMITFADELKQFTIAKIEVKFHASVQ